MEALAIPLALETRNDKDVKKSTNGTTTRVPKGTTTQPQKGGTTQLPEGGPSGTTQVPEGTATQLQQGGSEPMRQLNKRIDELEGRIAELVPQMKKARTDPPAKGAAK